MDGILISLRAIAFFTLLTGFVYPLLILLAGRVAFSDQARGSLIEKDGKVLGSELIGQNFEQPHYFQSRPSATSPKGYNGEASSGSNYGPLHPDYLKAVAERKAALGPGAPLDLLTASASGLDPHISREAARFQSARVAAARRVSVDEIWRIVERHTEGRQFGVLGEERVNVLKLNLALDVVK